MGLFKKIAEAKKERIRKDMEFEELSKELTERLQSIVEAVDEIDRAIEDVERVSKICDEFTARQEKTHKALTELWADLNKETTEDLTHVREDIKAQLSELKTI